MLSAFLHVLLHFSGFLNNITDTCMRAAAASQGFYILYDL